MSAHKRTAGELEAQRVKRERRYAGSVGKGFCDLYTAGRMCPGKAVRYVGEVWVCQHHSDLLNEIVRDANPERGGHPRYRSKKAAA